MTTLLRNARVLNVFTDRFENADILIDGPSIAAVGAPGTVCAAADSVVDCTGKTVVPGLIDGHIHIESTLLRPAELARLVLPHGTTAVVTDPHEIANVCGADGVRYMLAASEGLPLHVYVMLPSCVPATPFDESGASLDAAALRPLYELPRVAGLAEMMNYPGVLGGDPDVLRKLSDARALGLPADGHAPMLSGADLSRYIAAGVTSDHECTDAEEALEKLARGQWILIREGTAAKNLRALLPLFDEPYSRRALLCTDDRHPADLKTEGHIDNIIRLAIAAGKRPETAYRMATLNAAQRFGLRGKGAVAPGYDADLVVLDDAETVKIAAVYSMGRLSAADGETLPFADPAIPAELASAVRASVHVAPLTAEDFRVEPFDGDARVIRVIPGQLLTDEWRTPLDFARDNGIDPERDILKLAVIERHRGTGHKGIGYIAGLGMKRGAIASTVSHDSHNLIVVGASDEDMACAANACREMGGGSVVVLDGKVLASMPLPVAGLMADCGADEVSSQNAALREAAHSLGRREGVEPFLTTAFVSLPVIPHLKMTTFGLCDVDGWRLVPLCADNK